jgi:hypothetical protein
MEIAASIGEIEGTASSRLADGTEVAWTAHVIERDTAPSDGAVTVVGAGDEPLLLLRIVASPLAAMQIVRSLCQRNADARVGTILWLAADDASLSPFFSRPSAYLLVPPEDVGIEHSSTELLVAAGLAWSEVNRPIKELRAIVVARDGVAPSTAGAWSGPDLKAAATSMLEVLKRSTDASAIDVAARGVSELLAKGAAAALIRPLAEVLRDSGATTLARESSAHLLAEAGAIEPVLELVLADKTRSIVMSAFLLCVLETVSSLQGPLDDAERLGLPRGFQLDSEARLVDVEAAAVRDPAAWTAWLLERLPPAATRGRA